MTTPIARLAPIGVVLGFVALLGIVAGIGPGEDRGTRAMWVLETLVTAGAAPLAYLLGAAGLGRLVPLGRAGGPPLDAPAPGDAPLRLALGVAIMLTLSHAMGVLGLLGSGGLSRALAAVPVGLGLLLLARGLLESNGRRPALHPAALLGAPGLAVMLVAALSPPGWLWGSEFGGFDALSYHLQLPKEWLEHGRLWPVEHNVYSYLPGYAEGAYLHLGVLMGAGGEGGFIAGSGRALLSAQLLHAGLAVASAVVIGSCVRAALDRPDAGSEGPAPGALAAALVLGTPWVVVVGSLAYNEMGVVLLGAGALRAALDRRLGPARRGAVCGLLVGVACGCKPTALFFAGVPAGLALLARLPVRGWAPAIGAGTLAGLLTLLPWLVRNALACGNPVFPYASGLFGSAHWTSEQVARFAAAHAFDGGPADRLGLLVRLNHDHGAGGWLDATTTARGLTHPHWALFAPIVLAGLAGAWLRRPEARAGALLLAGLVAQLAAWLLLTHLQSRFLLPILVTGATGIGVGLSGLLSRWPARRGLVLGLAGGAVLAQHALTLIIFSRERAGAPNALLVDGVESFSGSWLPGALAAATPEEREIFARDAAPTLLLNVAHWSEVARLPRGMLYLLGDSTPLYFAAPVRYHTTWDRSPLGQAIRAHPDDPSAWSGALRALGVELVLIHEPEIERLTRDGWYDPEVTPQRVRAWREQHTTPVRAWPQTGQYLVRLR